jgi:hypothetical protein
VGRVLFVFLFLFLSLSKTVFSQEERDPYLTPVTEDSSLSRRLELRSTLLKWHQGFGLLTLGLLMAQTYLGFQLKEMVEEGNLGEEFEKAKIRHGIVGATAFLTYSTSAILALSAPSIDRTGVVDTLTFHKGLAFVHGTGMVLTPLLGFYISRNSARLIEEGKYEKYLTYHRNLGILTTTALFSAFLVITLP